MVGRTAQGREQFADVVGELVGLTDAGAVVAGRAGTTEVRRDEIAIARLVPASTAEELALQRVLAAGWRAEQEQDLGRWRLRAAGGFTRRANSVLVAGQPDRPLEEALAYATQWYEARGLPLVLQVPTEARRLLDAELGERGWDVSGETSVLVRPVSANPVPGSPVPGSAPVERTAEPGADWLARYRDGVALRDESARSVLTNHPHVGFAGSRDDDGELVAIGRGTLDDGWLAISCVEVAPAHRRRGRAAGIVCDLLDWGADAGAVQAVVAVAQDNAASLALFESLGFWFHHAYRYRHAPA